MEQWTVDIEGEVKAWPQGTITAKQVAELGGWDVSEGVIVIDAETNTERQLEIDEVVVLERDTATKLSKKVPFKRG